MKKLIAILIFILPIVSNAQLENANWYFGDSAGIKFTSTGVVPILNSSMQMYKGAASISDSLGNLLFYTQSQTVWNKDNDTIENGFGIRPHPFLPFQNWAISEISQGVMILPLPNHKGIYYLFSLFGDNDSSLVLSQTDMNQKGGLGSVTKKNKFIYTKKLSEFMTSVKHGNGRDYWIICHEKFNSKFIKFLLTPDSLIGPLYQTIGNSLDTLYFDGWGQSVFSNQGDKYLVAGSDGILKLLDFDRCSGEFSNLIDLSQSPYPYKNNNALYGCAFSPDGKKIYVGDRKKIFQYDLEVSNIISTKDTIWENPFGNYLLANLQLAVDNKIYFANGYYKVPNSIYSIHNMNLSVIDSPNNKGSNCALKIDFVSLGGKRIITGLPNIVSYSLGPLTSSGCDTLYTSSSSLINPITGIFPNPVSSELTIEILNGISLEEIKVEDVTGRVLKHFKPHQPTTQLNIADLPSGIYFLQIQTKEGVEVKKFVKQ